MSETPAPAPGAPIHTSEDEQILHKLGYAQELFRAMGVFRNFAISFTIISILAGCLTSYFIAFQWGGPVAVTWGWLIVGIVHDLRRALDGRDRVDLPDGRRSLLLVVEARKPGVGLVHRLVQPDRPDRHHRGRRLRPRDLRDVALQPALRLPERPAAHLLRLRRRACSSATLLNLFDVRITSLLNGDLRLLARDRRRHHRRRADHRARQSPVGELRLHGDGQQLGLLRDSAGAASRSGWSSRSGRSDGAVHAHRLRRLGAHGRGDPPGLALRRRRHDLGGHRLGASAGSSCSSPSPSRSRTRRRCRSSSAYITTYIWQESMGTRWAEVLLFIVVVAQLFCLTACITSGSRMLFAFSRDRAVPGHQAWRTRLDAIACPSGPWSPSPACGSCS